MSANTQRPWLKFVMVVGGAAFLGLSVLPFVANLLPPSATPTPSPQDERVSEAKGFELVLAKDPDNIYALRSLLEIRLQQKDLKGALPLLARLAKNHPDVAEYHILLAQTQVELGDKEAAVSTYRQFLQRQPGNLLALVGVTDLLVQLERPALAESIVQQSLVQVKPGQGDVTGIQIQMARIYLAQRGCPSGCGVPGVVVCPRIRFPRTNFPGQVILICPSVGIPPVVASIGKSLARKGTTWGFTGQRRWVLF